MTDDDKTELQRMLHDAEQRRQARASGRFRVGSMTWHDHAAACDFRVGWPCNCPARWYDPEGRFAVHGRAVVWLSRIEWRKAMEIR